MVSCRAASRVHSKKRTLCPALKTQKNTTKKFRIYSFCLLFFASPHRQRVRYSLGLCRRRSPKFHKGHSLVVASNLAALGPRANLPIPRFLHKSIIFHVHRSYPLAFDSMAPRVFVPFPPSRPRRCAGHCCHGRAAIPSLHAGKLLRCEKCTHFKILKCSIFVKTPRRTQNLFVPFSFLKWEKNTGCAASSYLRTVQLRRACRCLFIFWDPDPGAWARADREPAGGGYDRPSDAGWMDRALAVVPRGACVRSE